MTPLKIIKSLHETDKYIEMIFTQGGCYRFYVFLKKIFPDATPYISKEKDHIITLIGGSFYDATGMVDNLEFTPLTEAEEEVCKGWSFCNRKAIQISECGFCGEPIVV